jgi:hypothetical protein
MFQGAPSAIGSFLQLILGFRRELAKPRGANVSQSVRDACTLLDPMSCADISGRPPMNHYFSPPFHS